MGAKSGQRNRKPMRQSRKGGLWQNRPGSRLNGIAITVWPDRKIDNGQRLPRKGGSLSVP